MLADAEMPAGQLRATEPGTCGPGACCDATPGRRRRRPAATSPSAPDRAVRTDPLGRRLLAEFLGTGLLVAAVVGSGIAAAKLSPGNVGLELLENTAATVGALVALILAFGPVSGAHFNPVVTLADRVFGGISTA